MDDRTEGFNEEKISKLEVIKQPQLDYVAKNKDEAETAFKLNLEGMIVRMTDTAGKEKLAIVKEGKFCDYDDQTKLITYLSTDKEHGTKLNPASSETDKGDNGAKIRVYASAQVEAYTDALRVFYNANGDGEPDYKEDQKTLAPTATARNIGENSIKTTVEGFAEPGALVTVKYVDTENNPKTVTVKADSKTGAYTAEITPKLAEGTVVNVTAKLGEMAESDSTTTKVFEDADNDGIPDNKQDFDITKATKIEFVEEPDLTYLVDKAETEVTFQGKDGNGRDIFVKLSYKNGDKELEKIYTLAELKDKENVTITPALGTKDKITNDSHSLIDNKLSVALKNGEQADTTATFAIKVDADGNGVADEDEKNVIPVEDENTTPPERFVRVTLVSGEGVNFKENAITIYDVRKDANIRYADIYNEVSATTIEDYENIQWYNADQVVKAEGVITADVTLTAKATKKAPTEQIVEVTNPEENPPQGYMRVALEKGEGVNFTAEKYQGADKVYFDVLLDAGVRYYDVYRKVEAKVADGYKDLTWYKKVSQADDTLILGADPIIERDTVTLIAKATKQGPTDSIIEVTDTNSTVPKGYVRVTIVKGEGVTDVTGILAYDVKSDKSVRYSDIIAKIGIARDANTVVTINEDKYTQPLSFKVNGNEVRQTDYPLENTDLIVSAKLKDSENYEPRAKVQSVQQGAPVYAIDSIENTEELPAGTEYKFAIEPNTDSPGEQQVTIIVTYPDRSEDRVDTTITVEKSAPQAPAVDPIKQSDNKVVVTPPAEVDKVVVTLPEGETVTVQKNDEDQWTIPGGGIDPETGDPIDIIVPENSGKLEIPVDPGKIQPGTRPVEVVVVDKDGKESESTKVYIEKVTEKITVEVESLYNGQYTLDIKTSVPEATVVVKINRQIIATITTDGYGRYALGLENELLNGQRVEITADKTGYIQGRFRESVQ